MDYLYFLAQLRSFIRGSYIFLLLDDSAEEAAIAGVDSRMMAALHMLDHPDEECSNEANEMMRQ